MIKHLSVLVIDDDPNILELVASFLRTKGYRVDCREDARDGLEALRDTTFDLIVSDVKMAGMNGFEFLRITRANFPKIGIVIMTAYEEKYTLSEALRAGADGYISKPFSLRKFSLIFEKAYWNALSRQDWWEKNVGDPQEDVDG